MTLADVVHDDYERWLRVRAVYDAAMALHEAQEAWRLLYGQRSDEVGLTGEFIKVSKEQMERMDEFTKACRRAKEGR